TVTTLVAAQVLGWRWDGTQYDKATSPQTSFAYTQPVIDPTVRWVEGIEDLPNGFDPRTWRFVDLDGEGLTGLLTEQGSTWYYKRNEGDGAFAAARVQSSRPNASLRDPGVQL